MTLLKKTKDKKVNIDFNKEFIKLFNQKLKEQDIDFLDKSLKDLSIGGEEIWSREAKRLSGRF